MLKASPNRNPKINERFFMNEVYCFLGTEFDIDKAKELVKDKKIETLSIEQVQKLAPQLISHLVNTETGELVEWEDQKLGVSYNVHMGTSIQDKDWALKNANLDNPVIWFNAPQFSMLIDGYHRLYRAWKEKKELKVQVIDKRKEAKEIITSWIVKSHPVNRFFKKTA